MKILIAEDDPVSRRIIEKTLRNWGHEVIVTQDGLEALEVLQNDEIRFAVLDWMMPEIDGIELCRRVRQMNNDKYTYLILLTAKSQKYDIVEGLDSGADDYIVKPFNHDELRSRIFAGERILSLEEKLAERITEIQESNIRLKRDIIAASRIQTSLLPQEAYEDKNVKIGHAFYPCDMVGGDMLNFYPLNERYYALYISDVSGHGVPAAMHAVTISRLLIPNADKSTLCQVLKKENGAISPVDPLTVITNLNRHLQIYDENYHYVTMIYGIVDIETLEFKYVRAGHPPIMLLRDGKIKQIKDNGSMPLGINNDAEYVENTLSLEKGDRMYLYTDGLVETDKEKKLQMEINELENVFEQMAEYEIDVGLVEIVKRAMIRKDNAPALDDLSIICMMIK